MRQTAPRKEALSGAAASAAQLHPPSSSTRPSSSHAAASARFQSLTPATATLLHAAIPIIPFEHDAVANRPSFPSSSRSFISSAARPRSPRVSYIGVTQNLSGVLGLGRGAASSHSTHPAPSRSSAAAADSAISPWPNEQEPPIFRSPPQTRARPSIEQQPSKLPSPRAPSNHSSLHADPRSHLSHPSFERSMAEFAAQLKDSTETEREETNEMHSQEESQQHAESPSVVQTASAEHGERSSSSAPLPSHTPQPLSSVRPKLSHRLIFEKLYAAQRAEDSFATSAESSRPATAREVTSYPSSSSCSPRQRNQVPKLLALTDGLAAAPAALGLSSASPSTALTARPSTSPAPYAAGGSLSARPRPQSRRQAQALSLQRLCLGQSAVPVLSSASAKAGASHEWTFHTLVRQKQQREDRLRRARIDARQAGRTHIPAPAPVWSLEEKEAEEQVQRERNLPLYQRQGVPLPASKKSRRPPAQSAFTETSLSLGVLQKVERSAPQHYRVRAKGAGAGSHSQSQRHGASSSAAPAVAAVGSSSSHPNSPRQGSHAAGGGPLHEAEDVGLSLANSARLLDWRGRTNAWLGRQGRATSRQVSVSQMAELRALYDALDDDRSNSLDAGELATAMRVCGMRGQSQSLAYALLEWLGKTRADQLSFSEFAYAVLHYELPVGKSKRVFGAPVRMQPLFNTMMAVDDSRTSFSQMVLEFKRQRIYEQIKHSAANAAKETN